jgi:hypothetical protein
LKAELCLLEDTEITDPIGQDLKAFLETIVKKDTVLMRERISLIPLNCGHNGAITPEAHKFLISQMEHLGLCKVSYLPTAHPTE